MLALGLEYLTGWAMATHPADRTAPEWPPHPDRVFMALAAAHLETDGDLRERSALEWLERLAPPALAASSHLRRSSVTTYVPVNDIAAPGSTKGKDAIGAALAMLPAYRPRQARHFPAALPRDPRAFLIWSDAEPAGDAREALAALSAKVIRVGHSASLVQMWIEDAPPPASFLPSSNGSLRLRVFGPGRLRDLERQFERGRRPDTSLWHGYREPVAPSVESRTSATVFHQDVIVLRQRGGRRMGLESTLQVTDTLRAAVLAIAKDPLPEWLSGHRPDGSPSDRPHLAFVPLADVGHRHADGHLLGFGIAVPRQVDAPELRRVLAPVVRQSSSGEGLRVFNGRLLDCTLTIDSAEDQRLGLRPSVWTAHPVGATRWATVTPIVLDRYPKRPGEAETTIATACSRLGLPEPVEISVSGFSLFRGAPPAARFAPFVSRGIGPRRFHTHAYVRFDEPVRGPVLLGAGRYRGYGLCRPFEDQR
ncbi:MAG: type I-G CRISPR-associated protein Csb2 [Vicinamibacterales bacterium]